MKPYQRPSGSLISYMSNQVKTRGGINLAQGIPGFKPPEGLLEQLTRQSARPVHQYAPGTGNVELMKLILKKYRSNGHFNMDQLLITNGATEAVSLIYTYLNNILDKPYATLGFEPAYESYRQLPGIFGDPFIPFPYNQNAGIDFEKLQEVCRHNRVKIIFLNTPGNPYGRIWNKDEISRLVQICEQEDICLILDSVYQELYFDREPYHPVKYFNDRMFYVNSFSKIFSITGWRIGYMITAEHHMENIRSIHDYTGLCAPSVLQEALAGYISTHNWGKDYISDLRDRLSRQFNLLKEGLEKLGFLVPEIHGGFFVWARLPEGFTDGFQFAMDLYEKQGVAVIPGEHFSDRHHSYIRFNIAREPHEVEEGLERIGRYFRE